MENLENILAIELMAACQAFDLLSEWKSSDKLERAH